MENDQKTDDQREESDVSLHSDENFLIEEKTEGVDASGVDDHSSGMGHDDYLGTMNVEKKE